MSVLIRSCTVEKKLDQCRPIRELLISFIDGVPIWPMTIANSARRISKTLSTPTWPKEDKPQRYGLPIQTASAPIAKALDQKGQTRLTIEISTVSNYREANSQKRLHFLTGRNQLVCDLDRSDK